MRITRVIGAISALALALIVPTMTPAIAVASTPDHPTWVTGASTDNAMGVVTSGTETRSFEVADVGWASQPSTYAKVAAPITKAVLAGHDGLATASTGNLEATPLRDTGQLTFTNKTTSTARSTRHAVHLASARTTPTTAMMTATSGRQPATTAGTKFTVSALAKSSVSKEAKVTKIDTKNADTASPARSAG
jgi:hypothetical protein